jgi:uncharacterized protein (DUF2164 family)
MREKTAIRIPEPARKQAIASIRRFFEEQLDTEIGDLKASIVLDYFLAEHGPAVYNSAIADAQRFFEEQSADLSAVCHHSEFSFWDARKRSR